MSEPFKVGKYIGRGVMPTSIEEAFAPSQNKGTPQVQIVLECTEGPCKGCRIPWYGFFTDATAERTIESLKLLGARMAYNDVFDVHGIGSTEVQFTIEEETFNGRERLRVQWINKVPAKFAVDAVQNFRASMQSLVAAANAKHAPVKAATPRAPEQSYAPTGTDDKIPF